VLQAGVGSTSSIDQHRFPLKLNTATVHLCLSTGNIYSGANRGHPIVVQAEEQRQPQWLRIIPPVDTKLIP